MATGQIIHNGIVQTVILPKEIHLEGSEVEVIQRGYEVILRPKVISGAAVFDALAKFPEDFMQNGKEEMPLQDRPGI